MSRPSPCDAVPGLDETLATLTRRLLALRTPAGHWTGELASSALATATAVVALQVSGRGGAPWAGLVRAGLDWLANHRNDDGGWGDTVRSVSNISTTALGWAALSLAGGESERTAREAAEKWLQRAAGSLEPAVLAEAIERRYGKDRTFSVPILTILALSGRLGAGAEGWARVPQLPFELAVLPRRAYGWLRLPVVSYALPALVAIGQARHHARPTRNPLARLVRDASRGRTLRLLGEIQPASGGYLEAVPLTAFVVASLAAAKRAGDPVVACGREFLAASARTDGSWPIDTNLATWVTTLSVNALAPLAELESALPQRARAALVDWLLGQQYRVEHPYTLARPGGWAWTDLPGGVPDADDTAGALRALHALAPDEERVRGAAVCGVRWLLELQNRDGGIPTFCRGWGALPFDRSSPDLTAHALAAWAAWHRRLPDGLAARVRRAAARSLGYLERAARSDGAWVPLWFGNQSAPDDENPTYGTARVLEALPAAEAFGSSARRLAGGGRRWLAAAQNSDGGWGGAPGLPSSIEETGVALAALAGGEAGEADRVLARGAAWLVERTDCGRETPAAPIGFYFARLWYFEALYPLIFATAGLARVRALAGSARPRTAPQTGHVLS